MFNFIRERWLTGKVYMYMALARYDNNMLKDYAYKFQKHNAILENALNELSEITVEKGLI